MQLGDGANFVDLANVAQIEKTTKLPLDTKVLLNEDPSIAVGVQIHPETRIDEWSHDLERVLTDFENQLPEGISLVRIFEQSGYVSARDEKSFYEPGVRRGRNLPGDSGNDGLASGVDRWPDVTSG